MDTKLDMEVDIGYLNNSCKGEGHSSKFKVSGCQKVIFWLGKKSYLLKYLVYGHQIWYRVDIGYNNNMCEGQGHSLS